MENCPDELLKNFEQNLKKNFDKLMIEMKENSKGNSKKKVNPPKKVILSHSSEEVEIVSKFSEAENSIGFKKLIKSRKPKKSKKSQKSQKRNLSLKKTIRTKKKQFDDCPS